MSDVIIRLAEISDRDPLARLLALLWPTASAAKHAQELTHILEGNTPGTMPLIILVAEVNDEIAGFLEIDLRSHADGCDPSRPVGYVEGWYVVDGQRHQGNPIVSEETQIPKAVQ